MSRFTSRTALALVAAVLSTLAGAFFTPGAQAATSALSALESMPVRKVDHDLGRDLQREGSVDAMVTFRNDEILERANMAGGAQAAIELLESEYRSAKERALARAGRGVEVMRDFENLPTMSVRFRTVEALAAVASAPEVLSVTPHATFRRTLTESRALLNADDAAAAGKTGAGTYVAVLDTGADYTRAAFNSCSAPNVPSSCRIFFAKEYGANQDGTPDDDGHGTNVSGIVAGVAPGTKIFALDVFTPDGDDLGAQDEDIAAALADVVAWKKQGYNIRAVNMSLGWAGQYNTSTCTTNPQGQSNPMAPLFSQLRTLNVMPVVSAGNAATEWGADRDGISYPACTAGAVSVGAVYDEPFFVTDNFNAGTAYECSEWYTSTDQITCFSQSGPNLSLLAPGAYITAAGITQDGTSQAAPHVAAAVAILAAARPSASVDQIQSALVNSGPTILDPRFNNRPKHRLDVTAALAALPAADTTAPSVGSVTQVMPSIITVANSAVDSSGRVPLKATWTASDSGSGLAAFDAQVATNGVWTQLTTSGTTMAVTAVAPPGANTYQFRVRARDVAGNWSGWAYGSTFKLTAVQEDSTAISFGGTWTRPAWASALGGYEKTSSTAGSTATLRFTGTNVAWIAPLATNRGQGTVSIDGSAVKTMDLYSSTTVARAVAFSYFWTTAGTHTISVKVVGTANRPSIDVDAFVVMS
jgi:Subtilase family